LSRTVFPDGMAGKELEPAPRRIKKLAPKWCPVLSYGTFLKAHEDITGGPDLKTLPVASQFAQRLPI
jgi:hypothetical protein